MNLIIPMAGRGSRLRPHTLTVPKPVVPVAGRPIVDRLARSLADQVGRFDEIAFIIGDFGDEIEQQLLTMAESLGAQGKIYYQDRPLGPAHAISCARDSLTGPCVIGFADTLIYTEGLPDTDDEGLIWVKHVDDPRAYGVVMLDGSGAIDGFVEKPDTPVSHLAIVGIYYFKDGDRLRREIDHIISQDIRDKGEYQLTTALQRLQADGYQFKPVEVDEWLDCGNKNALIHANRRVLDREQPGINAERASIKHSCIIPPCYIAPDVTIEHSVIGPYVTIGSGTTIRQSIIENSMIQNDSDIERVNIVNSLIGNKTVHHGHASKVNIGDYSELHD